MTAFQKSARELWKERPRSRLLQVSLWLFTGLILVAWVATDFSRFGSQAWQNLGQFFGEITPYPLRGQAWDWAVFWDWFSGLMDKVTQRETGWTHVTKTISISIVAAVLAKLIALVLCWTAARTMTTASAWIPSGTGSAGRLWQALSMGTRALLVILRSLPEYILAFLLIGILGASPWPAILALAIHNSGILGRLFAETIENTPTATMTALRAMGASRRQVAVTAVIPQTFSRFLLYFFYRWETCVRDATVLGMLGIASLGFLIDDARVALRYDEMFVLVLVGATIVIAGDLVSAVARAFVRRA